MTLWIILTALTALAAAWLTIPLVRRHEARVDARAATIQFVADGDVLQSLCSHRHVFFG